MLSFLDRWDYCWKCEFDKDVKIEYQSTITMMENNYVIKKYISKGTYSEQKEGCPCNLCIGRNEGFQFIWQIMYSRQRQMPYSRWKKLT